MKRDVIATLPTRATLKMASAALVRDRLFIKILSQRGSSTEVFHFSLQMWMSVKNVRPAAVT